MSLSKNFTYRTIAAAALAMGLSLPVYAATSEVETGEPATNVVSQTTKVVTTTTTTRVAANHHAHHSKLRASQKAEVQQESASPEKRVIWRNGVIFNEVEPTAQSQSSPFGVPASTSDSLKGGVTSTISPAPTH